MEPVFDRLIAHFKTQSAVARHFGVTRQAVYRWRRNGIPSDRALEIESATKGRIQAKDVLREDRA